MNWSTPESVVISGGSRRIQDSVVELLEQEKRYVYRTDQDGAIRYVVDENGEQILCWDGYQWQEK
jgi:beta-lactamase superfamily II metal-dependent hydrolase